MENIEITLKFKVADVNVLLAGLGKLPLEAGVTVYENLKAQAQAQLASAEASKAPEEAN
jgi:hypothetical protein